MTYFILEGQKLATLDKTVLKQSSLGMLSLTLPLCTQLSIGTCIALEEASIGDFLYLGESCNISALPLKSSDSEIWISLNVLPEWLHWFVSSFF